VRAVQTDGQKLLETTYEIKGKNWGSKTLLILHWIR